MANMLHNIFLGGLFSDVESSKILSDRGCLEALFEFERGLVKIQGKIGLIPELSAKSLERRLKTINLSEIKYNQFSTEDGIIIPELMRNIKEKFLSNEDSQYLHWGVTSQDAIDTARCLQLRNFLNLVEARLKVFLDLGATKASTYKYLPIAARTRGQIAAVTTLGAKFAINFSPVLNQKTKLSALRPNLLRLSLGGAVGTLNSFGEKSDILVKELAQELNLNPAVIPWHTNREAFVELACICTIITSCFGKFGADVLWMAQSELQEVKLVNVGSSSAMPHKKNPIIAEALMALADINNSLLTCIGSAMMHRNERDGVAWTKEIVIMQQILHCTGAACKLALTLLKAVKPIERNIGRTIDGTKGLIFAENAVNQLSQYYQKSEAKRMVSDACKNVEVNKSTLFLELKKMVGSALDLGMIFDPGENLGQAPTIVENFTYKVQKENV